MGLLHRIQTSSHFVIDDVRVLGRGLDVSVVESPLDQLEVSGLPEKLGSKVVAEVMKPEVGNTGGCPYALPSRL